jgi:hypothetical protein
MRRAPQLPGVDLRIYLTALPLLVRNPSIVVVPLLMAVAGVLLIRLFPPVGGAVLGSLTGGIVWLGVFLLLMFGLGTACIIADDAWRHGHVSFDRDWAEARRRAPEILMASIGLSLILWLAQFVGVLLGWVSILLVALAAFFLIWAIPAAAIGGIPGAAAIQASIDRVRANPLSAALATIVTLALVVILAPLVQSWFENWLSPFTAGTTVVGSLVGALIQAITVAYAALIITKTYSDAAFGRRW